MKIIFLSNGCFYSNLLYLFCSIHKTFLASLRSIKTKFRKGANVSTEVARIFTKLSFRSPCTKHEVTQVLLFSKFLCSALSLSGWNGDVNWFWNIFAYMSHELGDIIFLNIYFDMTWVWTQYKVLGSQPGALKSAGLNISLSLVIHQPR